MTNTLAVTALKVLMIGNSFSISNCRNMPQIAEDLGVKLELGSMYIGGCSLERHWQNVVASTNAEFAPYHYDLYRDGKRVKAPAKMNIPAALESEKWDIVTIQQASPLSWKPETYSPFGDDLVKTIRKHAPQAEIVMQETWSYLPSGMTKMEVDQNGMYEKLHGAYGGFAAKYGFRVIPVGTAVQGWRKALPVKYTEADPFGGDVVGARRKNGSIDVKHLNRRGEYFQSLVWTAFLFGADVGKCGFRPSFVDEREAVLMKQVAMSAVNAGK